MQVATAWLDEDGDAFPCACGGVLEQQPGLRACDDGSYPWGTCTSCSTAWTVMVCPGGAVISQHDDAAAS